jgi:hypothetical protein
MKIIPLWNYTIDVPYGSMNDEIIFECHDEGFEDTLVGKVTLKVDALRLSDEKVLTLNMTLNDLEVGYLKVKSKLNNVEATANKEEHR